MKKLDVTKPLRSKTSKEPITLIAINGRGGYPNIGYVGSSSQLVEWDEYGNALEWPHADQIENTPNKKTGYMNIYPQEVAYGAYSTRKQADHAAQRTRIACVKVEYEEGQYDD
jgi:hypothetical protein